MTKRLELNKLDEMMMDIVNVHKSLWTPFSDDKENLARISNFRESKIPSVKWFVNLFVYDNPKTSVSNLVTISHGLVGRWAFSASTILSNEEILEQIESIWQRKDDAFENAILKIKKGFHETTNRK